MPPHPNPAAPKPTKTVLPNGLRVITERLDHVDSISLGLWVAAGSRDEPLGSEGITHFLEHMLFKGTETRSAAQIAEAIDDIGGNVNGFTDRESLYLYARTIGDQAEPALELLFDLLLSSLCGEVEVEREKEVVLQEIGHVEDMPEGWVHELLAETAWEGHPLGRPLMGTRDIVAHISRDALVHHLEQLAAPDRLILTAAGRLDHDHIVRAADRMAGRLRVGPPLPDRRPPDFRPARRLISRPSAQVHFCLATPGCTRIDPSRHAFALLDTVLGGGASSRLFQEIRENRGLTYGIGSYLQSYQDGGLLIVDAGAAPQNFQLVLDLVGAEIDRLRAGGPSGPELARAKTQLKVALALVAESTSFRMQHLAGSELHWGRFLPFDEILAGLEAVTVEDVHRLAQNIFTAERQTLVAIGPFEE